SWIAAGRRWLLFFCLFSVRSHLILDPKNASATLPGGRGSLSEQLLGLDPPITADRASRTRRRGYDGV
ncbi:MAG: hypothetical protein WBW01_18375, partial [Terriglobales bacterium]